MSDTKLTPVEQRIANMLNSGATYEEIGATCQLQPQSVRTYLNNIRRKHRAAQASGDEPHPEIVKGERRRLATCPLCRVTVRAPRSSPELAAFMERHTVHDATERKILDASNKAVWIESEYTARIAQQLAKANERLASQKQELTRLRLALMQCKAAAS